MEENENKIRICSRCISHETIPGISFGEDGVCNYCKIHENLETEFPTGKAGLEKLMELVEGIKKSGRGKKYDCIVGVSGGCDSSYLLYKAKELGLRPLAVHFDNTWNSEIATQNIHKILKKMNIDLCTYVVNNEEYDDIYRSFLKAGVKDIDIPTDIGLITVLYRTADRYGIKYILDGHSFRTEGIVPTDYVYMDGKYIESVHKKFGIRKLETYPNLWMARWLKWMIVDRIKRVRPLYYLEYNKEEAKEFLIREFDWQWYGGKHMENRYTIFALNYFLPTKFKINFTVIELSGLVRSGQLKRAEALVKLEESRKINWEIVHYAKKRLGFSDKEFDEILKIPKKSYYDYKTYKPIFRRYRWFFWLAYKANLVPQSFYMKYTK